MSFATKFMISLSSSEIQNTTLGLNMWGMNMHAQSVRVCAWERASAMFGSTVWQIYSKAALTHCALLILSAVAQFDNLISSGRLTAAVSLNYCIRAHTEMRGSSTRHRRRCGRAWSPDAPIIWSYQRILRKKKKKKRPFLPQMETHRTNKTSGQILQSFLDVSSLGTDNLVHL